MGANASLTSGNEYLTRRVWFLNGRCRYSLNIGGQFKFKENPDVD
jgi:hypothetical protein